MNLDGAVAHVSRTEFRAFAQLILELIIAHLTVGHLCMFVLGYFTCAVMSYRTGVPYLGPFDNFGRWCSAYYVLVFEQQYYSKLFDYVTGVEVHSALTGAGLMVAYHASCSVFQLSKSSDDCTLSHSAGPKPP